MIKFNSRLSFRRKVENPYYGKIVTVDLGSAEHDDNGNPDIIAAAGGK